MVTSFPIKDDVVIAWCVCVLHRQVWFLYQNTYNALLSDHSAEEIDKLKAFFQTQVSENSTLHLILLNSFLVSDWCIMYWSIIFTHT